LVEGAHSWVLTRCRAGGRQRGLATASSADEQQGQAARTKTTTAETTSESCQLTNMCRSADLRLVRIVKRWLRRRTRSIPSEETPTPSPSTAASRHHCLHHRDDDDDDDCYTSGCMSPINGGFEMQTGCSAHHLEGRPSSTTTECWRCHEYSSSSVPLSSSTRRRRAMCDDGVNSMRSTSPVSVDFQSRQTDSLLSVDLASDQSTGCSTSSRSSSSSSSSSTVACCFCRRWRRSRFRQTGGKRRTESDNDDEYRELTTSGVNIDTLSEASCLMPCQQLFEVVDAVFNSFLLDFANIHNLYTRMIVCYFITSSHHRIHFYIYGYV